MAIIWTQDADAQRTHFVRDEAEVYYCVAPPGCTLQQVADDFLAEYRVSEYDDGTPVEFSVDAIGEVIAALYRGRPQGRATLIGEPLRPYPA